MQRKAFGKRNLELPSATAHPPQNPAGRLARGETGGEAYPGQANSQKFVPGIGGLGQTGLSVARWLDRVKVDQAAHNRGRLMVHREQPGAAFLDHTSGDGWRSRDNMAGRRSQPDTIIRDKAREFAAELPFSEERLREPALARPGFPANEDAGFANDNHRRMNRGLAQSPGHDGAGSQTMNRAPPAPSP